MQETPTMVPTDISDEKAFKVGMFYERARWFVALRWIVVATFLLLAAASRFSVAETLGLRLGWEWLLWTGFGLGITNLCNFLFLKRCPKSNFEKVRLLVIGQILFDLVAVTVVVHKAGSLTTFAPFLYSIHIIMACIFFTTRISLMICLTAMAAYVCCVIAEHIGIIDAAGSVYTAKTITFPLNAKIFHVLSAITVWGTIWYFTSRLSQVIHGRNRELAKAHNRVREMFQISQRHMHQTAHQMKSPLAGIQSNLLLMDMHLGDNKDERTDELMKRTHVRCENLHEQVRDILHLANIKAGDQLTRQFVELDIATILNNCISGLEANAEGRKVTIQTDIESVQFQTDHDVMKVILDNLISNAINYSHEGGEVEISCKRDLEASILLKITDHGIGIPEDKIGNIFEDFFRTDSAKKHCRYSTGMGLAIVKHAAITLNIQICVESEVGKGTTFTLNIPLNPTKE